MLKTQGVVSTVDTRSPKSQCEKRHIVLRSGGLKVRLAQVDYVGKFKGKGSGRVFGNDQR